MGMKCFDFDVLPSSAFWVSREGYYIQLSQTLQWLSKQNEKAQLHDRNVVWDKPYTIAELCADTVLTYTLTQFMVINQLAVTSDAGALAIYTCSCSKTNQKFSEQEVYQKRLYLLTANPMQF